METLSILLVAMFFGNQQIRIQHFLKVNCVSFLKKFQSLFEKCLSKHIWKFFSYFTKKNPIVFLIDEKDVDSFFHVFWFFFVKYRIIRLSKGLLRETYSIKEFTFEPKLSIKASNWRLNYTWQDRNTLFILLKYLLVFACCQKNWNTFCILSKKLK